MSTWPFSAPRPILDSSLESEVHLPATYCLGPAHIFITVATSSAHLDVAVSPDIIFLFNFDLIPLTFIGKTASPSSTSCPAQPLYLLSPLYFRSLPLEVQLPSHSATSSPPLSLSKFKPYRTAHSGLGAFTLSSAPTPEGVSV